MRIETVTLTGQFIRLEPLSVAHVHDLAQVGLHEKIWKYMLYGQMENESDLHAWVLDILARQARGTDLAFAVIELSSGKAVGATRYLNIDIPNRGLEIGGTWYGPAYQGTVVNPEAKYLLLRHAFEDLGCIRVQFKTDSRNTHSQRAIERLGAVKEGVLRNHMVLPDGLLRDSVFYSILDREWPAVKARLEQRLQEMAG